MEECVLNTLWFSDGILFATKRTAWGARRGQQGETLVRTMSRGTQLAWVGQWNALCYRSVASEQDGSESQQLAGESRA